MSNLTGTGQLVRLFVRLDRVRLSLWMAVVPFVAYVTASSYAALYPTLADRRTFARAVEGEGALVAFNGVPRAVDTVGGFTVWRVGVTSSVLVALMSLFLVIRHTRGDEESGRAELVRAAALGRHAATAATLLVVGSAHVLVGLMVSAAVASQGGSASSSVAFGAAVASVGLVFAGVAAVSAQLVQGARSASGITGAVLAVSFAVRAIGDTTGGALTWASPIGWTEEVRAYAGERWWVLALPLVLTVALVAAAVSIEARRDVDAGLVAPRPGPPVASPSLSTPLGLAVRTQRAWFVGWAIGMLGLGLAFGAVAESAKDIVEGNAVLKDYMEHVGGTSVLADAYLATVFGIAGVLAAGYAIAAVLRLRTEETALRAELVLATAVSRLRWAASHVMVAVGGTVVLLAIAGVGSGITHGLQARGVGHEVPRLAAAGLANAPAALVLAGLALALFGAVPRAVSVAWGALVVAMLIAQIGPALKLPQWVLDISPFTHTTQVPAVPVSWPAVTVLIAIAAAMIATGLTAFRARDLSP